VYLEPVLKVLKENKKKFLENPLGITDQLINISALQPSYKKSITICLVKHWIKSCFGKNSTSILKNESSDFFAVYLTV
jgi:hypothetical protein